MSVIPITACELREKLRREEAATMLLDVREPFEFQFARIAGSVLVPMAQIHQGLDVIDRQRDIVVICHHGIRSQQVAEYLIYRGFEKVFNLTGGIDAWSLDCDPDVPRY
ncbi:MAG: rhodanese-like domain-containing protein [Gammaproteobacteria bacterium]